MKKIFTTVVTMWAGVAGMLAAPFTVCDFENYEIGHSFPVWNFYGGKSETTAVVEADPANASNKVLHITLKSWNDYIEFTLPDELAGSRLTADYDFLSLMVHRHAADPCEEWKHFDILLGEEKLYEDDGWPSQGGKEVWMKKTYELGNPSVDNTSVKLRLGYNSENTDYYIDDVLLSGRYDDYVFHESGELNFSDPKSTSSSYTYYSTPISLPAGEHLNVYTSRYTYWTSPIMGEGQLNIYGGGERSYLGNEKGAAHPDWSAYSGDVHVYPYPEVNTSVKAGFYGVVLGHGGKKFDSDNIQQSIAKRNVTSFMESNAVTIHEGATIAAEASNNARGYRIGTLRMDKGSQLMGYYKTNAYRVYYLVGCSDADSELAGTITSNGNAKTGLIKEGKGTYRISGNENNIAGALSVLSGRVLIENDIDEARAKSLPGAVGTGSNTTAAVVVYPDAVLGGSGHISGLTDVYGVLEPGSDKAATLTLADFKGGNKIDLRLRPTSRLRMKINSAADHDMLDISGQITYNNINLSLQTSSQLPVLEIAVPESHALKEGDRITLIKASGKSALNDAAWNLRVQYPKVCSWKIEETASADGYALVAVVTSLDYSGQGDKEVTTDPEDEGDNANYYVDYFPDLSDSASLRHYAEKAEKRIGVAASTWRYDVGATDSPRIKAITGQFNMVVAENEMKFDSTEPERNKFDYSGGDRIVQLAEANSMYVRGHTLVWHQQCPAWLSSNGVKNDHSYSRETLLSIMENHINNVMGHYKGRVKEWDVVNEMLADDQSVVRDNPDGYTLRPSIWHDVIGPEFIEKALEFAHKADPDAKLFINEYGGEFLGEAKSEALYNLAKYLVSKGAPLDGVGLQCHFTTGGINPGKLAANIRRYKDLGLECIITELDIAQADPKATDAAEVQAAEYGALVNAALSESNCPSVMLWGIDDSNSWRENKPLIYDASLNPKEAYYAVHAALRLQSEKSSSGIEETFATDPSEVTGTEYFNIQGMRLGSDPKGLVIKREYHSDGTVTHSKVFIR